MTEKTTESDEVVPNEAHLLVAREYADDERIEFPDWYDDTINVGDVANEEADKDG